MLHNLDGNFNRSKELYFIMKLRKLVVCLFICMMAIPCVSKMTVQAAEDTITNTEITVNADATTAVTPEVATVSATETQTEKKTTTKKEKKKTYSKEDLKLLSCIIWCEAGNQSRAGKIAVGCVVMNRVKSKTFPNTIRGVIYQRSQFGPVRNGAMHKALVAYKNGKFKTGARKKCVDAAKAVLEGQTKVTNKGRNISLKKVHFFNRSLPNAKMRIGAHAFK